MKGRPAWRAAASWTIGWPFSAGPGACSFPSSDRTRLPEHGTAGQEAPSPIERSIQFFTSGGFGGMLPTFAAHLAESKPELRSPHS